MMALAQVADANHQGYMQTKYALLDVRSRAVPCVQRIGMRAVYPWHKSRARTYLAHEKVEVVFAFVHGIDSFSFSRTTGGCTSGTRQLGHGDGPILKRRGVTERTFIAALLELTAN